MGDEPEEEFPRGRDYPKKKQVRQTKPNWELQSESYSPNARNARVDPRRGPVSGGSENEYSTYSGGNPSHFDRAPYSYHPYTPQYFGEDQYDYNGGNQTSYQGGRYPVNQRGYGSHAQGNRYPNSRTPTSKQHQPFAPYQDNFYNGKEFGKPNHDEGDIDTFIDHASPERPSPVNVNPQNGFVPIGYLQDRQLPAGIYPPGSPNEAPAASFAQNNKPQTPAAPRNPNSLIKPRLIGGFHDEPEPKSPGFDSHGVDTYSNSYNPSTRQDDSPQNGLSPPMYQQSSPQNTRSMGGFSAPIRTVQKHYSGLQQIPENESQKLSGEHKSQSANRANQNSNHNQVHASNPGSQLDEDLPPEADDMIEGFEYYGQPQNQQDNLQKVSPSNQPDSLRLISRNQLATAINFPHVGDSLMSTTGQYPNHNSQNPGRFTASSSNMIINNNLPRQDLLGNNPAVKPQFSHKQIIQSSQKQGYSMFAPNPTPVASNFQRSNDGGSATNIQRKQMLNSDRTISHEGMFKKPANQMHPLQQPVNPNDQYYQPNMQPSGYYGPLTSLPSISDPRTPVVVSGGMHGYQNNPSSGVQDQSSLSGRSPLSNAIYTRINNQPRAYHRSEQAIGHSQSHANWTSHQQPVSPVHSNHHPPGSTPLVEKRASPVRRNQPDGNVCIPIDEDGDYDDQELQKATDF